MKRIKYIAPVDWLRGSLSGRQQLTYTEAQGRGYDVPDGTTAAAENYQPRIVAKVLRDETYSRVLYYQVRTRSSVNMSAATRLNLALMGGVGALLSSLLRSKTSPIYSAIVAACPSDKTLRQFVSPRLRAGLAAGAANIEIATGITIVNPWKSSATPNVPVGAEILDKFNSVLSNL